MCQSSYDMCMCPHEGKIMLIYYSLKSINFSELNFVILLRLFQNILNPFIVAFLLEPSFLLISAWKFYLKYPSLTLKFKML
jgi:hypothetical protein